MAFQLACISAPNSTATTTGQVSPSIPCFYHARRRLLPGATQPWRTLSR
jgi:hypothetical protein